MNAPVYLDYAATTPVDPAVAEAMSRCLSRDGAFANAASVHPLGRAAAALVEHARAQVAELIGAQPEEIVFTSGATESNNLAVLGVARANADRARHVITSRIEHKSVLDACKRLAREGLDVSYVAPDARGVIDPTAVEAALRPETSLVSIMHVNNEIGVIEDIAAIGELCRARGIAFHTDAAQSIGRLPLDVTKMPVDFVSLTSHKIYGPKGVGALYVRRGARPLLRPITFGGGHERGLRPGTLPTHQIVGLGAAAEQARDRRERDFSYVTALRARLLADLERLPSVLLNGSGAPCVPHILNVSFDEVDGESLLKALESLAVSNGSACSSATAEPSYVLRALGRSARLAESSLRFSFGRESTPEEIDYAAQTVRREVTRLRSVIPGQALAVRPNARNTGSGGRSGREACGPDLEGLFRELPGAGALKDGSGVVLRGEAGGPNEDVWVRFHLLVEGDTVLEARFEARGCPYTLATAAWLTSGMRGRCLEKVLSGGPQAWARTLQVPVEKLGRLLVIEDALRTTLRTGLKLPHDN